jgi:hypothetical protein
MSTTLLLNNLGVAVRQQITDDLPDITAQNRTFLAILARMQGVASNGKYGGRALGKFTASSELSGLAGESIQLDFQVGIPVTRGVRPVTGSLESLEQPPQSGFNTVAGTITPSYYQLREDIRQAQIDRLMKDPKVYGPKLVKTISKSAINSQMNKLNEDLFPANGVTPTFAAGTNGIYTEDKISALGYPLQSGYVNNAATGSGAYPYLVADLNATGYTDIKALQSGDTTTGFGTPSPTNIRTKILLPMSRRVEANLDMALCDSAIFDYICTQAEAKFVLEQQDAIIYGATQIAKYMGLTWVYEPRLDDLYATTGYREIYFLDSSTWEFRYAGGLSEGDLTIEKNKSTLWLNTMLGKLACCVICHVPRYNAHAFKAVTS